MESKYRYFIYSSTQMEFQKKMEAKVGKRYHIGSVIYQGKKKYFTELSKTESSKYSDAKVVAQGNINEMKYTLPRGE